MDDVQALVEPFAKYPTLKAAGQLDAIQSLVEIGAKRPPDLQT